MRLVIHNAKLDGEPVTVSVNQGVIDAIKKANKSSGTEAAKAKVIDAGGKHLVPSLKNGHTHAAMTLLRGFADDMKLQPWLEEKIWPIEASLSPEQLYWGTRLAILEMIKSGTTFSNDMYFHFPDAWRAYQDGGIKAAVGPAVFDFFDKKEGKKARRQLEAYFEEYGVGDRRVRFSPAPHAIYTVSEETLRWVADFSRKNDLPLHIHLSETEKEVRDCIAAHGVPPAEYLESIGFLGPNVIAAHALWLGDREVEILAVRGVTVVHNPVSNMKLASGSCFPFARLKEREVPMMLGTDGCSSNNNLDMLEEMKIASILQKQHFGDPELMTAEEIFTVGTGARSSVYPHISGKIEVGAPADLLLVTEEVPSMVPTHRLISNLVYSAGTEAVDTVICDGEVLMEGRRVPGEEEVLAEARRHAAQLVAAAR